MINLLLYCSPEAYDVCRHFCEGSLQLAQMAKDLLLLNLIFWPRTIHSYSHHMSCLHPSLWKDVKCEKDVKTI